MLKAIKKIAFLKNLKLRAKLFFITSLVFVGFLFSTVMGVYIMQQVKIGSTLYKTIQTRKDSLEKLALLKSDLNQVRGEIAILIDESDTDKLSQIQAKIDDLKTEIESKFNELSGAVNSDELKVFVSDSQTTWQEFISTVDNEMTPAITQGKRAVAMELAKGIQKMRYERFIEQIGGLVDTLKLEIEELEENADKDIKKKITLTVAFSCILFLIIFGLMFMIANSISSRILPLNNFALALAKGNLTVSIEPKGNDEIASLGNAVKNMADNLKDMLTKVRSITDSVSNVAGNITAASNKVLEGSGMQMDTIKKTADIVMEMDKSISSVSESSGSLASSSDQTSSSIMQMASSIEKVAENSNIFSESAEDAASSIGEMVASIKEIAESLEILSASSDDTASSLTEIDSAVKEVEQRAVESVALAESVSVEASDKGISAAGAAIKGMEEIKTSVGALSDVINRLGKRSEEIGRILNVIDEVADQTSLLALNAAILAAQAGEQGKGFAVVADEIKSLAERTSLSTQEISTLISSVQAETKSSVDMAKKGLHSVDKGLQLVGEVNRVLHGIVDNSRVATEKAKLIRRATTEESQVIKQITEAIRAMTEQIEHISRATREQSKGSKLIIEVIDRIKDLSHQVKTATSEQSVGSKQISEAVENVSFQAEQIAGATSKQKEQSSEIVNTIEDIRKIAEESVNIAYQMNSAVKAMGEESISLLAEIQKFKVG
jgi:methyl-accepting chemotaxis protein